MSRYSIVFRRAFIFAIAISLLIPASGLAHALFADHNPNRPVVEYVWIGFWHMVAGWDHLLFILGVVLIAGAIKPAARLISLFVAGHSLTLIVATVAGWQVNATVVDVVIAVSLVYVGVQGLMGRPDNFRLMGAIVFEFGLVHGLGLSTRLQDLGLPESGLLIRVILFNIGVELGQLTALAIIMGLGTLAVRTLKIPRENAHFAYDPDLPDRHHQALKEFVDTKDPPYAIAAPDPEQAEPLRVIAALRTLTCREPDMEALTAFYDSWMLELQNLRG